VVTQRVEAMLLAKSSYAVRALLRRTEARERIDAAFRLLRDLEEYPTDRIEPMSEADQTLRALADHYADIGPPERAIDLYQELLTKLTAWKLDARNDLRDATCLSRTWLALATLLRRADRADEAAALDARRIELSDHWGQKLRGDTVVLRQISGPS
jgi:tetratricopeptide (TPR) repeat protein